MGQGKTHGQEKREKEKDRDKKSCWKKKKKWLDALRRKPGITRKRHVQQQSSAGSSRVRAYACLPQPRQPPQQQPWRLPRLMWMLFCSTRSCSHQVYDQPPSQECHCPSCPPPTNTAQMIFLVQLPQTSWIWGQRMRKEGEESWWPSALQKGPGDGAGEAVGSPPWQSPTPGMLKHHPGQASKESKMRARW